MLRGYGHTASAEHWEPCCYSIAFAVYKPCTISEYSRKVACNGCLRSQIQHVVFHSPNNGDIPPQLGVSPGF